MQLKRHTGHRIPRPRPIHSLPVRFFRRTLQFFSKNTVMTVALFCALLTAFFVPPDRQYLSYFDFKTLACLFSVLAVVCALKNIRFFYLLAKAIVTCFRNTRICILVLVYITFLGSMLIANDMALLTFLPLGYLILHTTQKEKYLAFTFIMQNIAANLGGMLTPFGNPQNLYLYTKFGIPNGTFLAIMAPPFCLSIFLITLCCLVFVKSEPMHVEKEQNALPVGRTIAYLCLFALSILIVFRGIPYLLGMSIIVVALLFLDRDALRSVDYPLLLTFVFFFLFAGNMGRIDAVASFFSSLLAKAPLLTAVLCCQGISNVPSAILLSQFTTDYRPLLLGVNIGGVGTLISSLASLITFREYTHLYPERTLRYLGQLTAFHLFFLTTLTLFCSFLV